MKKLLIDDILRWCKLVLINSLKALMGTRVVDPDPDPVTQLRIRIDLKYNSKNVGTRMFDGKKIKIDPKSVSRNSDQIRLQSSGKPGPS